MFEYCWGCSAGWYISNSEVSFVLTFQSLLFIRVFTVIPINPILLSYLRFLHHPLGFMIILCRILFGAFFVLMGFNGRLLTSLPNLMRLFTRAHSWNIICWSVSLRVYLTEFHHWFIKNEQSNLVKLFYGKSTTKDELK